MNGMDFNLGKNKVIFNKKMSELDKFVLDFVSVLEKSGIKYVIVSGYVSIVFGRSRNTEDVDLLVERLSYDEFSKTWGNLSGKFECLNTTNEKDAYEKYLKKKNAIRFSRRGMFVPNIEFKFVEENVDIFSLSNAIDLIMNGKKIKISPIEMQIAYKMYLGSDKDLEDAKFLHDLFKEKLNMKRLGELLNSFKINRDIIREYLSDFYEN